MIRRSLVVAGLVGILTSAACTDQVPTYEDPSAVPVDAETVELLLPFHEFADNFQVFGGFGSVANASTRHVALEYEGDFQARTLFRFLPLPGSIQVTPPGEEDAVADSAYIPVGGRLVVRMDTVRFRPDGPVELEAAAVQTFWDELTVSWTAAVDTLGERREWDEPGGGPARTLGSGIWDPEVGDSIVFQVDSLTATEWRDSAADAPRTARISSLTPGLLLDVASVEFQAELRPSVAPDTLVTVNSESMGSSYIYTPEPELSPDEITVAGAPARRTYFRFDLPQVLEEGSSACTGVAACPLELTPEQLVYAGVVLQSRPADPPAFQPLDTLRLDARLVLAPDRVPRSPLGGPVLPDVRSVPPGAFEVGGDRRVELPVTAYLADLLRDPEEEEEPLTATIALLSAQEAQGFGFARFAGPGQEGAPFLRLILTLSEGVELP